MALGRMPPLEVRPMPAFRGWAVALGPGIVWMALAQGSGELIWWPYLVAKYGLAFVGLLIPACLLQWPLTHAIGRYTVLTGETIWQGFIRMSPWFALGLWAVMTLQFLWFGAFASAGGTALGALTGWPADWSDRGRSLFWGYATIAVFVTALVLARRVYSLIERFMTAVALLTLAGMLWACADPQVAATLPAFARGLVRPEWPEGRSWDPADATRLLTAIAFAGLGGFWTLFYSYWLREKGAGMAAHVGHITGLLGVPERIPESGFLPDGDAQPELRRWLRFLKVDAGIGIFGNLITTLMTALLAFALLFPSGHAPEGWQLAVVQSRFFEAGWGEVGRAIFLLVAAAFLADTWLSTCDAVARVHSDVAHAYLAIGRRRSPRFWYFAFVIVLTLVTCATMPLAEPGPLMSLSALIGFAGTVVYTFALARLNYVLLPREFPLAASPAGKRLLQAVGVCYAAIFAAYLWVRFAPRAGS